MNVIVASKNPVKTNATLTGFKKVFLNETIDYEELAVTSDVADQPMSDAETLRGAINRVKNAKKERPNADYWVGLEGGIDMLEQEMVLFGWVAIVSKDGMIGKGKTVTIPLPNQLRDLVQSGTELGAADDKVFGKSNTKQGIGTVGLLTHGLITRTDIFIPAVIIALIPVVNRELYT